jgi:GTPase
VVVAGTVKRGTLVQGSNLLLGPHAGDASFKLTGIKSIAYKRLPVAKVRDPCHAALLWRPCVTQVQWSRHLPRRMLMDSGLQVVAGQTAALALKKVKRSSLRKVG